MTATLRRPALIGAEPPYRVPIFCNAKGGRMVDAIRFGPNAERPEGYPETGPVYVCSACGQAVAVAW